MIGCTLEWSLPEDAPRTTTTTPGRSQLLLQPNTLPYRPDVPLAKRRGKRYFVRPARCDVAQITAPRCVLAWLLFSSTAESERLA